MKKILLIVSAAAFVVCAASCCGGKKAAGEVKYLSDETTTVHIANPDAPEYDIVNKPQVDLASLPQDKEGYYIIFDGTRLDGWRGYGKDHVPGRWTIEDKCLKFSGTGTGEGQTAEGGDIIFEHKFQNFILEFDWKISKGGNSGVFYLAQEVTTEKDGKTRYEHIYLSAPEYQILDNANHPDALLGKDGNRQSASLYDMIPAVPQNQKPFGEWNKGRIMVFKGTVVHGQNDANVLEYHLWTDEWTNMLQNSKFSQARWPIAFDLLNNCGGPDHSGYIGFQDHGDDVWYKNIRVKVLD